MTLHSRRSSKILRGYSVRGPGEPHEQDGLMRNEFLPFSRPCLSAEDADSVREVLASGWVTTGPKAALFEDRFREAVGAGGAVALASGTAGLHLALKALDVGPGDDVVTPSMTWVSAVNLIVLAGARPVFADVERDSLMVSAETLEGCLSDRTKAIVPVHFAGAPLDMDAMRSLGSRRGIPIVEDAAHALGARRRGVPVGSRGSAVFSFHPSKNITTGEGGMLCTDDEKLLERVRRLKFHGLGKDAYDRQSQGRAPLAEVLEPGFKYNMTDIAAALGLSQLRRLAEFSARRRELALLYLERLADIEEILPLSPPDSNAEHAWHLFVVRLDIEKAGLSRDVFMERLRALNIGTGLHFKAVHLHRYYREHLPIPPGSLPNTEWNSERICSLPLFPDMTEEDVGDVVAAIKETLKR